MAIRLLIAVPAIVLSYLCLLVLPVLVMLAIGGLSGTALTAGAPSSGGNATLLIQIPFVTGLVCSLIGLIVGPGLRPRLAALLPALCYFGFIALLTRAVSHLST